MECANCNHDFNGKEKSFVWKERHVSLINSEHRGYSRRDTYRYTSFEDVVCKDCYRRLKRNSIVVPIIFWLLLLAMPVCAYFFCGGMPILRRVLYILPCLLFLLALIESDFCYSFIGFLLRPILGVYNLHPLGQQLTRREQKEVDEDKRRQRKEEQVINYLVKHFHLSYNEALSINNLSGLDEKLYGKLSTRELVRLMVPDNEALQGYLSEIADNIS